MPYKVKGKCVYKKDTGKKVGCTKGSVKKYLAALHMHENGVKLKEEMYKDLQWIHDVPTLVLDDEELTKRIKALHEVVGSEAIFGDLTKPFDANDILGYDWYGITNFELEDGTEWVVGTEEEFNNALYEYWYNYVDDVGLDYINQYDLAEFIEMYEGTRQDFANNEADYFMTEMTDEDILERSDYDEEYEELEEQIDELRNEIEDEIEDEDGVGELENKISELEEKQLNLLDRARELVFELLYEEWYECLEDPYECLVNEHGYYSSVNDLIDNGLVHFDQEEFASSYASSQNWYDLPTYGDGFDYVDGYIITRID